MYVQPLAVTVVYVQFFVISKVKVLLGYIYATHSNGKGN